MDTVKELKELGLTTAANKVEKDQELLIKMHIAYDNYQWARQFDIDEFNTKLKKKTERTTGKEGVDQYRIYDKLVMIKLEDYKEVPPQEVLKKLREAKSHQCFDYFEIAKIESVEEYEDPVMFGRINGCGDYFYIAQWDDDVTFEEIKSAVS